MHIRVDDTVEVITGDDRGTRAKVLRSARATEGKVVVEGVNRVYKHVRRSQKNPQGGRLSKEMPISIVERAAGLPACGQPARTGARLRDDGSKDRVLQEVQCGDRRRSLPAGREKKPTKKSRVAIEGVDQRAKLSQ